MFFKQTPTAAKLREMLEHERQQSERWQKQSIWYQAQLYHSWRTIASQQKGMQRMARKLKRLRQLVGKGDNAK